LDIAKNVFQVHGIELAEKKADVAPPARPGFFTLFFAEAFNAWN
jgi:hypothetical protein